MKITKEQLKRIIKEEVAESKKNMVVSEDEQEITEKQLNEDSYDCKNKCGESRGDCYDRCIDQKRADREKRAEKSMRQAVWRESQVSESKDLTISYLKQLVEEQMKALKK